MRIKLFLEEKHLKFDEFVSINILLLDVPQSCFYLLKVKVSTVFANILRETFKDPVLEPCYLKQKCCFR